jgi:hypothetical protein
MPSTWESKGEKIHTRNIGITTYAYDGQRIIIEGLLRDDRMQDSHVITGETFPAGVIHHMAVRLLVNCSTLLIEDVDAELIRVPRDICRETLNCLAPIKGLTITRGFTAKVKKLAGGTKGCTHVVELLLAMAPAAIQGYAAHQSRKPADGNALHKDMVFKYLVNTCHAWREDGPFAATLKKKLHID